MCSQGQRVNTTRVLPAQGGDWPGPFVRLCVTCSGDAGRGQTLMWLQFLSLVSDGADPPWTLTQPTSPVSRAPCLPKTSRSSPPKDESQGCTHWGDKPAVNLTAERPESGSSPCNCRRRGPRGPQALLCRAETLTLSWLCESAGPHGRGCSQHSQRADQ